ncbi:Dual specificity protein kinase Ttk, partial [Stegodyphus mimosarum]
MIKFYWGQMLEAVADIHKYGIIHSDLKPANFLLVAGNLKLIDFGIAASVPDDMTSTFRDTQVGTLNFISPEAITQLQPSNSKQICFKVGVKSDVWSLGCILYYLVYNVPPFHNCKTLMQKVHAITNPSYEISFPEIPDKLLLDVLKSCLKRNVKERASVEELLKHPYLNDDLKQPPEQSDALKNVLEQVQVFTPRRMSVLAKVVKELSEKTDI